MISVAEALERVLTGVSRLGTEELSVADAHGRVLAEDVFSRVTQPPANVSAMDGYAVRAVDCGATPVNLTQIGESAAGSAFLGDVGAGQAVRIFTGAPVPAGADAIVIQENTEVDANQVTVKEPAEYGRYIRQAGLDFKKGEVLLKAGRFVTARDISLSSAMNIPWLRVVRKPRIAILSTGDELVMPGEPLGPNQIISSNNLGLGAFLRAMGAEAINLGIAKDTAGSLLEMLKGAGGSDMLVTIGGASVGDHDLVKSVLGQEGLEITFSTVAMRPGKPLIFGKINGRPMLGLPGNPVSAGVTSVLFLRPAIEVMLGVSRPKRSAETAKLGRHVVANDFRQDYLRASLSVADDGTLIATPFEVQDSSMLALFAKADCLVIRAPDAPAMEVGERVEIIRLGWSTLGI